MKRFLDNALLTRLRAAKRWFLCLFLTGCAGTAHTATPANIPPPLQAAELLEIARRAEQLGDTLRAQQYLLAAARSGASAQQTLPWLLRLYIADGQYRLAIDTARETLRRHPEQHALRILLASLYEATDLDSAAVEEYERALQAQPDDARAHFALAALLQPHEPGRADTHYRAYLALAPQGEDAARARAALLQELP
jgi:Tfp pilus assembly protein PilF